MAEEMRKIFPSEASGADNLSLDFTLNNSSGLLFIDGMSEGDCASLEVFLGDECDGEWAPFKDCCGQVTLNGGPCCSNFTILPLPLKYRVVLTNEDDEHLSDPNWFEDVSIWYKKIPLQENLSQFYHSCCEDLQATALENIVLEVNRVANRLENIYQTLK